MKTAYIFHDAFCDPTSDWYPWIKTNLESQGYVVVVPKFPTPAGQSYTSWRAVMREHLATMNTETIIIGHGIGGTFALRLLEEITLTIRGLFLVASYTEPLGHVGYDRVNTSFIEHSFNWNLIRKNVSSIAIFAGEGDPFVPQSLGEHLATALGTSLLMIPAGGHVNRASGFIRCEPLLEKINNQSTEIEKTITVESSKAPSEDPVISQPSLPEPALDEKDLKKNPHSETVPGIHTMYQDMTTLVNSNQGKVTSSLLTKARTDKEEATVRDPLSSKNVLYIIGTLAVILLGVGIGIFFMSRNLPAQKNQMTPDPLSLLPAEHHTAINILNKQSFGVAQAITQAISSRGASGTITDIYYTQGSLRASFIEVLTSLDRASDIPNALRTIFVTSNIGDRPVFMHTTLHGQDRTRHALILPITQYDAAFSGFKAWEPTLLRDIGVFMNISPAFLATKLTTDTFQDEVITNKNIRVLRYQQPSGDPAIIQSTLDASPYQENEFILGYFFLNDATIVIVDNPEIIPELLTRYANRQIYN